MPGLDQRRGSATGVGMTVKLTEFKSNMSEKNHKDGCCMCLNMILQAFDIRQWGVQWKKKVNIKELHLFLPNRMQVT